MSVKCSPMVMPNAGRRLARVVMLDHCAAARPLSTLLMLKGGAGAGGCNVDGCVERVSSGLTIGTSSEVDEQANESNERAEREKVSDSALRWRYERKNN